MPAPRPWSGAGGRATSVTGDSLAGALEAMLASRYRVSPLA
jgi:NAD(P)H-hydrate repair Nnr-like enzyme with NAD(P)H-hydrate dehydratase domain